MVNATVPPAGLPLTGGRQLLPEPDSPLLSTLHPYSTFFVQIMAFFKT